MMSGRRDLIDQCAEIALRRLGVPPVPPVDLRLLASRLGVDEIVACDLLEDGRLERAQNTTRILLRAANHRTRNRFTLAHELAHLLVANGDGVLLAHRDPLDRSVEERTCDALAAAIVLPRSWVRDNYADRADDLSAAVAMARHADVSLSAAVVRLRELCEWRSSLLRFVRQGGTWRLVSVVGASPRIRKAVAATPQTSDALEQLSGEVGGPVRGAQLDLTVFGHSRRVAGGILMRSESAAMLAPLPGS